MSEPKHVKMPWRTTYNNTKNDVFVMRHMETYVSHDDCFGRVEEIRPRSKSTTKGVASQVLCKDNTYKY